MSDGGDRDCAARRSSEQKRRRERARHQRSVFEMLATPQDEWWTRLESKGGKERREGREARVLGVAGQEAEMDNLATSDRCVPRAPVLPS